MLYKPKRVLVDEGIEWGIVLWQLPDGTYIEDDDGNYLCAGPCALNNPDAEKNMFRAAANMGVSEGKPFWLPGFRKVTDSEWEDQMERLMDGKVPDPVEAYRQATGVES